MKILSFGPAIYFRDILNQFDFFLITVSIIFEFFAEDEMMPLIFLRGVYKVSRLARVF